MKTLLTSMFICCCLTLTCCSSRSDCKPDMSECYAKIENPALRQFIIDYIDERIAEHKAIDPEHVPDVHTVALTYEIEGDTLAYNINKTCPGWIIFFS